MADFVPMDLNLAETVLCYCKRYGVTISLGVLKEQDYKIIFDKLFFLLNQRNKSKRKSIQGIFIRIHNMFPKYDKYVIEQIIVRLQGVLKKEMELKGVGELLIILRLIIKDTTIFFKKTVILEVVGLYVQPYINQFEEELLVLLKEAIPVQEADEILMGIIDFFPMDCVEKQVEFISQIFRLLSLYQEPQEEPQSEPGPELEPLFQREELQSEPEPEPPKHQEEPHSEPGPELEPLCQWEDLQSEPEPEPPKHQGRSWTARATRRRRATTATRARAQVVPTRTRRGCGSSASCSATGPPSPTSRSTPSRKVADCSLQTRSDKKTYKCDICGNTQTTKSNLTKHKEIHMEPRKCSECPKKFKQKWQLERHKNTHGVQFRCSRCKRTFRDRTALRNHEATHKGEKKFSCCKCRKRFTQNSHRNRHQQTCKKSRAKMDLQNNERLSSQSEEQDTDSSD